MRKPVTLWAVTLLSAGCAALAGLDGDFVIGDTMTSTVSGTGAGTASGTGGSGGGGVAGGGAVGGGGTAGSAAWLAGYGSRKEVVFAATQAQLADFVAAVVLEGDADLMGAMQPRGQDVTFTTADGTTQLSHEIEIANATAGNLAAWVRLPSLSAASDTSIYLYWGNPGASDQQDVHGTWTDRYAGVWHLGQDPSTGASATFRDSSHSGNDGQLLDPVTVPTTARGIAGRCLSFDGNGATVTMGDPADESLDFGTGSFAFSVWVYVDASAGPWDMPWFKGGSSIGTFGYDFELGTNSWNAGLSDGSQIEVVSFGSEADFLGGWAHLMTVIDRSSGLLLTYANGAASNVGDIASFGSVSSSVPAGIGHPNHVMAGRVDEVRVYAEALSAPWIDAEYRNLAQPTSFYTVGPTETAN